MLFRTRRYLGPTEEFFTGISTVCFTPKNTCTYMHPVHDVRSCEYTQPPPPPAFTWTWTTTRVKRVDMLYLGAYTEGGRYFRWALLRVFTASCCRPQQLVLRFCNPSSISLKHVSTFNDAIPFLALAAAGVRWQSVG